MPLAWETDTGEVTLRELSGVRLVLSRHGFSLLPSAASSTFLCMQVRPRRCLGIPCCGGSIPFMCSVCGNYASLIAGSPAAGC